LRYKDEFRAKKRKQAIKRLVLFVALGAGVLAGGIYVWFFSGAFAVTDIEYSIPDKMSELGIKGFIENWLGEEKLKIARTDNIFLIHPEEISATLLGNFPEIKKITVLKEIPHKVSFNVEDRKPEGIWCGAGKCFYFDDMGIAYSEAVNTAGFIYTIVRDSRGKELIKGHEVAGGEWLDSVFMVKNFLPSIGFSAREFMISADSFDEFIVETDAGFKIFFSLLTDISDQMKSFSIAWKEKMTPAEKAVLEYVDLKIDRRIYYK